jgi:hypothetical protein
VLAPGVEVTAPEELPELDEDEDEPSPEPDEEEPSSHPPESSPDAPEDESSLDDELYGSLDVVDDVDVLVVGVAFFAPLASAGSSPS